MSLCSTSCSAYPSYPVSHSKKVTPCKPKRKQCPDIAACRSDRFKLIENVCIPVEVADYGLNSQQTIEIPGDRQTEFPFVTYDPTNVTVPLNSKCIRNYPLTDPICISSCTDFNTYSGVLYLNRDLVIADPPVDPIPPVLPPVNGLLGTLYPEINNGFPNLIGINGSLYIVGTSYYYINAFKNLRWVTGKIVIVNNNNLVQMPDFPSLVSVGGQIIANPPIIPQIEPRIAPIPPIGETDPRCGDGSIVIANNNSLDFVSGFGCLEQVANHIFIASNACLREILGFTTLKRLKRFVVYGNGVLNKISGFNLLETANELFLIENNNLIGQQYLLIRGFNSLEYADTFAVIGNKNIETIPFNALKYVAGDFVINSNSGTKTILIKNLKIVGNFYIELNENLVTIINYKLKRVNGTMSISKNCALESLPQFNKLRTIGAGLIIAENKSLRLINCKFNALVAVGALCLPSTPGTLASCCSCRATLDIDFTELVTRVACAVTYNVPQTLFDLGASACRYVLPPAFFSQLCRGALPCGSVVQNPADVPSFVRASIIIFQNFQLTNIDDSFGSLQSTNAAIFVIANPNLKSIRALKDLKFALDIWIRNNKSIQSVQAFANLETVRDFVLLDSPSLEELDNLGKLTAAQFIAIESLTISAVKLPCSGSIKSVLGYITYNATD